MTSREAYVMGWVYGYLFRKMGFPDDYDRSGKKFSDASENPYVGFVYIHKEALRRKVITDDVTAVLAEALSEISVPDEGCKSGYVPLPIQGSWQLGYYHGKGGKPLPPDEPFDIAAKRKAKGLTQAQLAELLGVEQAQVSRWETGTNKPSEAYLEKLQEALS